MSSSQSPQQTASDFWTRALNLDPNHVFSYTVETPGLGDLAAVITMSGITENNLAQRIEDVWRMRASAIPAESSVVIRSRDEGFEVLIIPEDEGSDPITVAWTKGERARPRPDSIPRGLPPPGLVFGSVAEATLDFWVDTLHGLDCNPSWRPAIDGESAMPSINIMGGLDDEAEALDRIDRTSREQHRSPIYSAMIQSRTLSFIPADWQQSFPNGTAAPASSPPSSTSRLSDVDCAAGRVNRSSRSYSSSSSATDDNEFPTPASHIWIQDPNDRNMCATVPIPTPSGFVPAVGLRHTPRTARAPVLRPAPPSAPPAPTPRGSGWAPLAIPIRWQPPPAPLPPPQPPMATPTPPTL